VNHWKKFFAEHKKYIKVGRVLHPPIDPASSIPEPCDPKKRSAPKPSVENSASSDPNTGKKETLHEEL